MDPKQIKQPLPPLKRPPDDCDKSLSRSKHLQKLVLALPLSYHRAMPIVGSGPVVGSGSIVYGPE